MRASQKWPGVDSNGFNRIICWHFLLEDRKSCENDHGAALHPLTSAVLNVVMCDKVYSKPAFHRILFG